MAFLPRDNQTFTGPTVAELRRLIAQEAAEQLCLWGEIGALSIFWDRLKRIVRCAALRRAIYKIERVQQPDGRTRFDLFVSSAASTQLLQLIRGAPQALDYGWYVRPHVPYIDRVGRGAPPGEPQRPEIPPEVPVTTQPPGDNPGSLRVATYNINSVARKRADLRYFLQETRCDVLGLQETLLRSTDWHLRLPQYTCFTAMGDLTASTRGVALAVSTKFACNPVGNPSPYWVFARLYGASLAHPIVVGTVYVPCRAGRHRVLTRLPLEIAHLRQQFPEDPLILVGDWNMDLEDVQREVVNWPHPVHPLANHGLTPTRPRGGRVIDHIAYWGATDAAALVPAPRVLEDWDLSDHYPVLARFPRLLAHPTHAAPPAPANSLPRIRVKKPESRESIASSNRWSVLADDIQETLEARSDDPLGALASLSQQWTDTCHLVAKDEGLIEPDRPPPTTVSRSIVRAIKRRRRMYRELQRAIQHEDNDAVDLARTHYREAHKSSRKAVKRVNAKRWHKQIYQAHVNMLHRPRDFWSFSSRHGRWNTKGAPAGLQPIYAADGSLLTALPDIVNRWAEHYETLGTDVTGHSQDGAYWSAMDPEPRAAVLDGLDAAFGTGEVWAALRHMKRHKAPGKDGVPTDFLQACLKEKREGDDGVPLPTPMTDCLVALTNHAYRHSSIPPDWEESVVLSLPKDGDLADCGNYRGISLMSTTLKVITVILVQRISRAGEDRGLFSPTQAGFRKREECITQAACVIDILQRRRIANLPTLAVFVDFKKAYDTVPHGALFAKLSQFGVRGRCLAFLKGLYARSRITVRVGNGSEAQYSDPFSLQRGLRQG